ncbi:PLP-dependent aminotransferase family protein, partial [Streptomyces sp. SID14478]|nr:PLP-dependent aminotransferase family protein [Streptomyces sp. SID14478]
AALKAAAWRGVAVDGLAEFRHPAAPATAAADGLVVGYAAAPERAYGAAVDALCDVLPPPS